MDRKAEKVDTCIAKGLAFVAPPHNVSHHTSLELWRVF
jgi:hypothetical protein